MTDTPLDGPLVTVSQDLIQRVGLEEAIALQMLRDWLSSSATEGNNECVAYTIEEWQHMLFSFWSVEELKRIFDKLEKRQFLRKTLPFTPEGDGHYYLISDSLEDTITAGEVQ